MTEPNNRISPVGSGYGGNGGSARVDRQPGATDFEKLLRQQYAQQQSRKVQTGEAPRLAVQENATGAIHFSKHALQRLEQRQISLGPEQNRRLENAVEAAAGKGARQSLVYLDGIAFIVNVQDRMVVTALQPEANTAGAASPVFTNIDSAVLA